MGEQMRGGCERGALTMCALEKLSQPSPMRKSWNAILSHASRITQVPTHRDNNQMK
ncbi:hypothetical protein HMPREF9244_01095 [Alloscardovia omnicolens F0580]|uniref:Uncharacterized protein n=1 Tax=Alloscardovia omnicolens F0580 TaxID=1321816 RepID=U1SEH4_9BIFI|nr:hypothetical protein HMPREF9244_01095 [Alloscardovia omnicolens F0580]